MSHRFINVTVEGRTYRISEMWLAGATRSRTYAEAVRWWHEQSEMELAFRAQQNQRKAA